MFDRGVPSGRLDATRDGNTVTINTRGVTSFTLLLSPDQFDLGRPVTLVVNGFTSSSKVPANDLRTLMKWAARDNDRTMLFAAELKITLAGGADR